MLNSEFILTLVSVDSFQSYSDVSQCPLKLHLGM